ncbi:testis-expressed protein 48 isoform X5 [Pongo abelii]|uniref:testis-expressed protein 48 isoform X5 n=1 Tax=Pongo abelii TaxID=9601 RepID=UPI00300686A2
MASWSAELLPPPRCYGPVQTPQPQHSLVPQLCDITDSLLSTLPAAGTVRSLMPSMTPRFPVKPKSTSHQPKICSFRRMSLTDKIPSALTQSPICLREHP